MSWLTGIKSFFAFDGVANSALKIVDKIAPPDRDWETIEY